MSWNIWPKTASDADKCIIPFVIFYTPRIEISSTIESPLHQNICECGVHLNPYVDWDSTTKIWICPLCFKRNSFDYEHNSEMMDLPQLKHSTFEYKVSMPSHVQNMDAALIFVIDTNIEKTDFLACKAAIVHALRSIPQSTTLGLISFGSHVSVYELGFRMCSKSHIMLCSNEDNIFTKIFAPVSKSTNDIRNSFITGLEVGKYLRPASECLNTFIHIIEELCQNPVLSKSKNRPLRCTGVALKVATNLLLKSNKNGPSRIMLFSCGAATLGPGKVVDTDLEVSLRSHKDINNGNAQFFASASSFYLDMLKILVNTGSTFDCFMATSDQVGLAEMKNAIECSGGIAVLCDSFESEIFKQSLRQLFQSEENKGYSSGLSQGKLEILCSRNIQVTGVLGPVIHDSHLQEKLKKYKPDSFKENANFYRKAQNKYLCKIPRLNTFTTICIIFDIIGSYKTNKIKKEQKLFIQIITRYNNDNGDLKNRVTTITRPLIDNFNAAQLISGFDPEAAAVVLGRLSSHRSDNEKLDDIKTTNWLDRRLINICDRFAKDDCKQSCFSPTLSLFIQLVYYLRRSKIIQTFNNSPDQTAYYRMNFNCQTISNSLLMFQPKLKAFSLGNSPKLVPPNFASIYRDKILVLDNFFIVVVFHGASIARWRREGYDKHPEYSDFAQLLQNAYVDAEATAQKHFPRPLLINCEQNDSKARYLLANLSPSASTMHQHLNSEIVVTDEVCFEVFFEKFRRNLVNNT
jgi:protein transport protein SEC23